MIGTLGRVAILLSGSALLANASTTIWAGTRSGLYKSVDSGSTWQTVSVNVANRLLQGTNPQTPNVAALALDPQQPSVVYFAGTMQGSTGIGFYRSSDNGKTWDATMLVGIPITYPVAYRTAWILIDPVFTNVIYLGWTGGGIARSTDYGATFTKLTLPIPANTGGNPATPDGLSVDPNTSGVLYMSAITRIFRSTDFGATWTLLPLPASQSNALRLADVSVTPGNSSILYVTDSNGNSFCGPSNAQQLCGLFRSADAGQSWKNVAPAGSYREVVFDSRSPDQYAAGDVIGVGSGVLKSSDGGVTWTPVSNQRAPHLVADPGAGASLFGFQWGNNAWFRSSDGGGTFAGGFIATTGLDRAVNCLAVPSVLGNVSAASFQSGPVTAESIVSALGFHLATAAAPASTQPAPTSLAGTTVTVIDANGTSRAAPLFYVSPGQVNYEIPAGTAPGVATIIVKSGDGVVSSGPLGIDAVAPSLFTLNASGLAAAYALRVSGGNQTYENVYQLDSSNAVIARPISLGPATDQVYLLLYGTGIRAAGSVQVTIAGTSVPVAFAGAQGQFQGEDQINIGPLPRNLIGAVSLALTADGKAANPVTITIAQQGLSK